MFFVNEFLSHAQSGITKSILKENSILQGTPRWLSLKIVIVIDTQLEKP